MRFFFVDVKLALYLIVYGLARETDVVVGYESTNVYYLSLAGANRRSAVEHVHKKLRNT